MQTPVASLLKMPERKRPADIASRNLRVDERRQRQRTTAASSSRETGVPNENRLASVVTCACIFYDDCRSVADDFPEHLPNSFQDSDHYVKTYLPLLYDEARETVKSTYVDCCEQDIYWDVTVVTVQEMGGNWTRLEIDLGEFRSRFSSAPRLHQNLSAVLSNVKPVKRDPLEYLMRRLRNRSKPKKSDGLEIGPATAVLTVVNQIDWETGRAKLLTRPICPAHAKTPTASCQLLLGHLRTYPDGWMLFPTGALVTQQRECDILHSLNKIPILDALLKPDTFLKCSIEEVPRKLPIDINQDSYGRLHRNYDPSQADAILMCTALFCKEDIKPPLPVVLIQGPPGTGKTHTVEGILNLWHLIQFERFYKFVVEYFENDATELMTVEDFISTRRTMKPRILVCAPSNAAVDELLERILNHQFRDSAGHAYNPNLVRIGAEDAPYSDTVLPVVLDTFVSNYFRCSESDWERMIEGKRRQSQDLESRVAGIQEKLLKNKQSASSLVSEFLTEMEELVKVETEIRRLEMVEPIVSRSNSFNERHVREMLEVNFLNDAEIVFTTLSSTGKKLLSKIDRGFETVLIDEAAQASEVAALQPLVYGCKQCVLVGDPQQLPATIISQRGKELNMERSLFARLQEAGAPVKMLLTQYRMHPWIRQFPSAYFYNDRLNDATVVKMRSSEAFYDHDLLKPFVVFDIPTGQQERQGGGSLQNQVEADLAVALFKELRDYLHMKSCQAAGDRRKQPAPVRVGVLTPYRSQVRCLSHTFTKLLGNDVKNEVSIMTIDSFQGKQLDVVIFSCVRGSVRSSGVGFVADTRRMNVAITRARKALWILGNFRTLISHPAWAALADDAKRRECFVVKSTAESLFPHQQLYKHIQSRNKPQEVASTTSTSVLDVDCLQETKDPRVGVIRPLEAEEEVPPSGIDVAGQDEVPATVEASTRDPDLMEIPNPDASPAVVQNQAVEGCSTSTAASATEDADRSSNGNASGMIMVSPKGAAESIGPSLGTGASYLVVDTPTGVQSMPVSVLLNVQPGLPMSLMQQERREVPPTETSFFRLLRGWLGLS